MNACLRPSLLLVLLVWLSVTGPCTARPPWPSGSGSGNNDRSQRPQGRNHACHGGHGREQRARLRKVLLGNGTAVCNDGSPAGLVPYCSSDAWSGATSGKTETGYAFMGSLILQSVVRELLDQGLYEGKLLLLAGSRIADLLASLRSKVKVRGVVDSGWFLDNEPFEARECLEPYSCAPVETIKRGIRIWNGQVPDRCKPLYPDYEQWRCYFGYRIYPTLKAPTFVFQWVFDEAQMVVNNVAAPSSKAHWDYIHALGSKLRSTLMNVTPYAAGSSRNTNTITTSTTRTITSTTDSRLRKMRRAATSAPLRPEEPRRRSRERPGSRHAQHRWRLHEDLCQHWLMDSCAWPQCNRRCPRMLDPMTGRELRFSDLLRSFGLDVAAVAAALGLDQAALAAMQPDALLHAD
ncbi:hypothetical protein MTO96_028067 [Rhipicephalus appendiculatus]